MSYDTPQKRRYRRSVWRAVQAISETALPDSRVAILDTASALESAWVLSLGVKPEKLTVINWSPAQIAGATVQLGRMGLPRPELQSGDFNDVITKRRAGGYDVISFDGMGCVSSSLLRYLQRMSASLVDGGVITVTVLAGREYASAIRRQIAQHGAASHSLRVWMVLFALSTTADGLCRWHPSRVTARTYVSHTGQPMLWIAARMHAHRAPSWLWMARGLGTPMANLRDKRCRFAPPCLAAGASRHEDYVQWWWKCAERES